MKLPSYVVNLFSQVQWYDGPCLFLNLYLLNVLQIVRFKF